MDENNDNNIVVLGAREHNLQNVDITIPRNELATFCVLLNGFELCEAHPFDTRAVSIVVGGSAPL